MSGCHLCPDDNRRTSMSVTVPQSRLMISACAALLWDGQTHWLSDEPWKISHRVCGKTFWYLTAVADL